MKPEAPPLYSVLAEKRRGYFVVFKVGVTADEADDLVRVLRRIGAARRAPMEPGDVPGMVRRRRVTTDKATPHESRGAR